MNRIEELKARHAKELAQAEKEESIRDALPSSLPKVGVHVSNLYGTVASLKFGDDLGFRQDKAITWDDACRIVGALPPVALTMVKDGSCTSFQGTEYVESLPEEKKERWDQESPVSPIRLNIDKGLTELEWEARTPAGIVRVSVHLGYLPRAIGTYQAERHEFKGGFSYLPVKFSAGEGLHTVFAGDEPIAQLESPIRWASGGAEYPQRITCYFCDLGADMDPAVVGAGIVEYLAKLAGKKP